MTNLEKFLPEILLDVFCTTISKKMGMECRGRECTSCKSQLVEWLKKEYIEPKHDDCANCYRINGLDNLRYCSKHDQTVVGPYGIYDCKDFVSLEKNGGETNE